MMSKLVAKISLLSMILFVWSSCTNDGPDPMPKGNISIQSLDPITEGIRGHEVDISFTGTAEDGLSGIVVTIDGTAQNVSVTGQTSQEVNVNFTIPGNAILNASFPVEVEITDQDGDNIVSTASIVASALLTAAPDAYTFERAGTSTVSYDGQNDRLAQVEELKAYLKLGDNGEALSAAIMNDAYANTNDNGNGFFSFSSSKQLKSKSFQPDVDAGFMSNLFAAAEAASLSGQSASNGVAGLITRENSGNTVLVDGNGREFTQMIEKGIMGTVMYNQIYNVYFSDGRTGDDVENTALREGKNYTDMEHHWDEAFGYWNPPLDFSSNWPEDRASEDRFWSHYSNVVDPFLGTNSKIMEGFLQGRTAIVNNDLASKNAARTDVANQLDIVAAATGVHYINSTLTAINEGNTGEAFHVLSEAWAFVNALKYNPNRRISLADLETILETDFGADGNFWNVTVAGLNKAKQTLVAAYPELANSQDDL